MSDVLVLIAEDDPNIVMTLDFVLRDEGFDVMVAPDGVEALRLARSERPDIILLDDMMPRMGGKEVLAALRTDVATFEIPVFVLSGLDWTPEECRGARFLGKPFDPDEVVDHIRAVLAPIS